MPPPIAPVELKSDEQIAAAFDLMAVLRPHLNRESFVQQVRAQQKESGYRLVGGFTPDGRLVTLAGYKRATTLARGPHLFVDDLVTLPTEQSKGYAKSLLAHLAQRANE